MTKKLVLLLFIIILIASGYFLWQAKTNTAQVTTTTQTKKSKPLPKEVTITLDKNGFSPNEVTIKQGTAIRWKNSSGDKQTVNSDDYPTNQKHKELNFGIFNDGSSVVYTFTKPGTYGFHNQFKPEQKGKVFVEK